MLKSKILPDIKELLVDVEDKLLFVKKRYYFLKAYQKEIKKCLGDKEVSIANDVVWQMLSDSYDMLIIDLSSLCKSMYNPKGFFNKLNNHLKRFKIPKRSDIQVTHGNLMFHGSSSEEILANTRSIEEKEKNERIETVKNSLNELFLYRKNPKKITQADIENLRHEFISIVKPVLEERDSYRAHKFESSQNTKLELLKLDEIGKIFKLIEKYLNNIRLITTQSTLEYTNMNCVDLSEAAEDICDQILMGTSGRIIILLGLDKNILAEQRKNFYEKSFIDDMGNLYSEETSLIKKPD